MNKTAPHTKTIFKLNGERVTRHYSAEICNEVTVNNKTTRTATGLLFDLTFIGPTNNHLRFDLNFNKRYVLNEKNSAKTTLNTVEKLALEVAKINDHLSIEVSKNFKLIKILNTKQIRDQWERIRGTVLKEFDNISPLVHSLDQQLMDINIQEHFKNDLFFNSLFSAIYYYDFNSTSALITKKTIPNAIDNIALPIIETKEITNQNRDFSKVTVSTTAELDTNHPDFDLQALNNFAGKLASNNAPCDLHFNYKGTYHIEPDIGLITQSQLLFDLSISNLYNRTATVTINLDKK